MEKVEKLQCLITQEEEKEACHNALQFDSSQAKSVLFQILLSHN